MKFLTDENVEAPITRGLLRRRPDLDVLTVREAGLAGRSDQEVLAWASREGRVVVSRDRATMAKEAARRIEEGERMPGLLLVRRGSRVREVIQAIELLLDVAKEGEMEGVIEYTPF